MSGCVLGHEERPLEVDVDHSIPLILAEQVDWSAAGDTGRVHDHVEPAVLGHHLRHGRLDRRLVADVDQPVGAVGQVDGDHRRTLVSEAGGAGLADARRSPGDERHHP